MLGECMTDYKADKKCGSAKEGATDPGGSTRTWDYRSQYPVVGTRLKAIAKSLSA